MNTEDSNRVAFEKQELDDTLSCCICTEFFTDPKALPCIHTFCMKCLQQIGFKAGKGPGDEMPCPICRGQFKIPHQGFSGLPNNFFIAKLIQVAKVSNPSESSSSLCDVCLSNDGDTGTVTPEAEMFCTDCKQKLCKECCRYHNKFKLNKNHKLIPVDDQQVRSDCAKANLAPSVCELHEQKVLDVYCDECKTVECAICFIDGHKHHSGSHVSKYADNFCKQIKSNIETINCCSSQAQMKKEELDKTKGAMQQEVERLEEDVMKRRDEIKQLVESQANSLLRSLSSSKQSKLKEIQMEVDDIDAHLSCLQSYSSYGQKMMAIGSDSDICRAVSDLSVKSVVLQGQCQSLIEREIQSFKFCFEKSEFEECLEDENLIGEIKEDCSPSQKKTCIPKVALIKKKSKIDLLKEDINLERREKETFRLENEQLKIIVDSEKEANKILKEELNKNSACYSAKVNQLKLDIDNEKATSKILQTNTKKQIEKLNEDLDIEKTKNTTLQCNVNKLKKDFDTEQATVEKLNKEMICKRTENMTLNDDNKKLSQEVETKKTAFQNMLKLSEQQQEYWDMAESDWRAKILDVEQKQEEERKTWTNEKQQLIREIIEHQILMDKLRSQYKLDAVLVQTIRTKAAKEQKKSIAGLTTLDNELFVLSHKSSKVEVYDSTTLNFSRQWNLKELIEPQDIVSCNSNGCLYIVDYKGFLSWSNEILRVDPNGNIIKKWSTGSNFGYSLSVTNESNVILPVYNASKLSEYSPDGKLIRDFLIQLGKGFCELRDAIKLKNGHFVVSLCFKDSSKVCLVNEYGHLTNSLSEKFTSSIVPFHLFVDSNGFVMVVDRVERQVLLFNSDMNLKKEIVSSGEHNGLRRPTRIHLEAPNGRLFLADDDSNNQRILIFDFKK